MNLYSHLVTSSKPLYELIFTSHDVIITSAELIFRLYCSNSEGADSSSQVQLKAEPFNKRKEKLNRESVEVRLPLLVEMRDTHVTCVLCTCTQVTCLQPRRVGSFSGGAS